MPSTRASACLAKTKGKRVKADTDEADDDLRRDGSYEDDESEEEVQKPPPRKRQRTTAKQKTVVVRKKQVRGKQGRLAGLVNMPVDIFTEVASHLLPGDIISLARSNKFFRNMLMDRSSIHIWHGVMKNVEGLPPCPTNMTEPRYLALLFSKTCSMCGAPARINMDPLLLVRFCSPCRDKHLMPLGSVPLTVYHHILYSISIAPAKRRQGNAYVLREDVASLLAQYEETRRSKEGAALEAWTKDRDEIIGIRHKQALEISRFQDALEWDRGCELMDIKDARQLEINRRLKEMGWTEQDMDFCWTGRERTWSRLVNQSKPLTDRIWANLQPKLIPLLEANRKERERVEREERKDSRKQRLSRLLLGIKDKDPLVLTLKAHNPVVRLSATMPTIQSTYRGPFPDFAFALDWPLVLNLYETDSSVEEMEARFQAHRGEIEGLITEWKDRVQTHFVGQLRVGYENKDEAVRPAISVFREGSDPLANVSNDLKLLLRADSLFYKPDSAVGSTNAMTYGAMLSAERLDGSYSSFYGPTHSRKLSNLNHIQWYSEAHEAAQELLADLGRPDASYLEMKAVGFVFACGRCHNNTRHNWEGMVQHYVEQKRLYAKIQEDESLLSNEEVIFNDVHDPPLLTGVPLMTDYATKALEGEFSSVGRLQICKVCQQIPAAAAVLAPRSEILKHLLHVHEIDEPKLDEHYVPERILGSNLDLIDCDGYDSDDSYLMDECDCPAHSGSGGYNYGWHNDPEDALDFYDEDDEDEWW